MPRVALLQIHPRDDPPTTLKHALDLLRKAQSEGAHLAVLPELFLTPYFCQREDPSFFSLAEPVPGPTTEALSQAAAELGMVIVAGIFERRAAGIYHNTAVVLNSDGTLLGRYRKTHIPDDPRFYEKYYFTPGDLGYPTFRTSAGWIAPLVCYDQWYPEPARLASLAGAQILIYPTAIGYSKEEPPGVPEIQREAWKTIQRSHAIANGVFVASVNRVGVEEDLTFWGSSFVCGPLGEILSQASTDREEVVLADLDFSKIERTRQGWPFLRDRRIDTYSGLSKRWMGD